MDLFVAIIITLFIAPYYFWFRASKGWRSSRLETVKETEAKSEAMRERNERERERDDARVIISRATKERDDALENMKNMQFFIDSAKKNENRAKQERNEARNENIKITAELSKVKREISQMADSHTRSVKQETKMAKMREESLLNRAIKAEKDFNDLTERYSSFEDQYIAVTKAKKLLREVTQKCDHNNKYLKGIMERVKNAEAVVMLAESGSTESLLPLANSKSAAEELTRIKISISDMIKDGTAFSYHHRGYYKTLDHKSIKPLTTIAMRALKEAHELLAWKIKADKLDKSINDLHRVAGIISDNLDNLCGARFSSEFITLKALELNVLHTLKVRQEQEKDVLAEVARDEREMRKAEEAARAAERKEREAQTLFETEVRRTQAEEARQREMMEQLRLAAENAAAEQREEYAQRLRDMEERAAQGSAEAAEAIRKLKADLKAAQDATIRATAMASLTRTGYVYVISNEGSFGEEVVKIGLTRRIDPQERIKELSGASVPFPFDVHMMLFSEDAPALEAALHSRFSDSRVNTENLRKEFFRVGLDQVEAAVSEIAPDAVFTKDVQSPEWLRTVQKRTAHLNRVAAGN